MSRTALCNAADLSGRKDVSGYLLCEGTAHGRRGRVWRLLAEPPAAVRAEKLFVLSLYPGRLSVAGSPDLIRPSGPAGRLQYTTQCLSPLGPASCEV